MYMDLYRAAAIDTWQIESCHLDRGNQSYTTTTNNNNNITFSIYSHEYVRMRNTIIKNLNIDLD